MDETRALDLAEIAARGWENFLARTSGPLSLRFVIQPCVAGFMALRAGLRDAREGRAPFFVRLFKTEGFSPEIRHEIRDDIGAIFVLAVILDFIYQVLVQRGVYFLEMVFTAVLLAVVPYMILRGPVSRVVAHRRGRYAT